jgi:transcriptional regulator with XRE-family HTH domain
MRVKKLDNPVTRMSLTREQCRMARAALSLGVRDVAALANVSPNTIARLERGEALYGRTLDTVRAALEEAGVVFLDPGEMVDGGAGVRLRKSDGAE